MRELSPGTVIGERFRVERTLGAGGMGCVVLARNVELDELVAVKVLLPEGHDDGSRRQRMIREARAAVKIKSPHVVRVFDVVSQGPDAPYIVMEYLEGESLRARLNAEGTLSVPELLDITAQICEAVGEAHLLGIVHRDLKPENVFCVTQRARAPICKVLDFGISKALTAASEQLTTSQSLLGSPAYAPPEQLRASRDVGPPADIWAIGVLLYEALVGERPFLGTTLMEVCVQILETEPIAPSSLRPELPKSLDRIVLRCLKKNPAERFQSVDALLAALRPLAPEQVQRCLDYLRAVRAALPVGSTPTPAIPTVDPMSTTASATALAGQMPTVSTVALETGTGGRARFIVLAGLAVLALGGALLSRWASFGAHYPAVEASQHTSANTARASAASFASEVPQPSSAVNAPSIEAPLPPLPAPSTTPVKPSAPVEPAKVVRVKRIAPKAAPKRTGGSTDGAPAWSEVR